MEKHPKLIGQWLNIIKMAKLPRKLIYRCAKIPVRIPADFFAEFDKLIPKFI